MSAFNSPQAPPSNQEGVSPQSTISPQTTGITSHNPTPISPQITGITNTSTSNTQPLQPLPNLPPPQINHQQPQEKIKPEAQAYQGIEVVGPNQNTMASQQIPPQQEGFTNEKPATPSPLPSQYHTPPPQGQGQGQYPPQEHYAPQGPPQANINQGKNHYATALPIRSLQSGPSPVDCPVCGVREVTRVEHHSGMTTQYVYFIFRISFPFFSFPSSHLLFLLPFQRTSHYQYIQKLTSHLVSSPSFVAQ